MVFEERQLDKTHGDAEALCLVSKNIQIHLPVVKPKPLSATVVVHGAELEEELPDTDIEDAVPAGIRQCENRRGRRHADPVERRQEFQPLLLTARGENPANHRFHRCRGIPPAMPDGAGALPGADLKKLTPRDGFVTLNVPETKDQAGSPRIFPGDRLILEQFPEGRVFQFPEAHVLNDRQFI